MNLKVSGVQTVNTPTGPFLLHRHTIEALLKNGVISGTLGGELHAADAATVKAALMAETSCDFCGVPGASEAFDVPMHAKVEGYGDLKIPADVGWHACESCAALVKANKREALLDRSCQATAFAKFTKRGIRERHEMFWAGVETLTVAAGTGSALVDFLNDKIPVAADVPLTGRDRRIDAVMRATGLTRDEIEIMGTGKLTAPVTDKLTAWAEKYGMKLADFVTDNAFTLSRRQIIERVLSLDPRKPTPDVLPHWERAWYAKYDAMKELSAFLASRESAHWFPETTDPNDPAAVEAVVSKAAKQRLFAEMGFAADVKRLSAAATYSFNAETTAAICEAARSMPHDARLSEMETPEVGAGWFWFSPPFRVGVDRVNALLWGWDSGHRDSGDDIEPSIVFTTYMLDTHGKYIRAGKPAPHTRWYWPVSMSFHEMIALNAGLWDKEYGPGGPFENARLTMPKNDTLLVVAELSLFFMQACVWFNQKIPILTKEAKGIAGRQTRKRIMKEHRLSEPPLIRVVALRASERVAVEHAPSDRQDSAREYSCRWIVKGHNRRQSVGPGRKEHKVIWITAHPAGPKDKPLRVRETVFAVVR